MNEPTKHQNYLDHTRICRRCSPGSGKLCVDGHRLFRLWRAASVKQEAK